MKIAILGSSGYIGQNLALAFPDALLVKRSDFDIMDPSQVCSFFNKNVVDLIINCVTVGGSRSIKDGPAVIEQNLRSYYNIASLNIPTIFFSSGAAIHCVDTPYGFSKKIIEEMNKAHNHVKIIRIFGCTGGKGESETRFPVILDKAAKNGTTVHIFQDRYFDYIHIDNLIKIIKDVIYSDINEIINAVDPGPSLKLSEIAMLKGVQYTIGTDVLGSNYTAA